LDAQLWKELIWRTKEAVDQLDLTLREDSLGMSTWHPAFWTIWESRTSLWLCWKALGGMFLTTALLSLSTSVKDKAAASSLEVVPLLLANPTLLSFVLPTHLDVHQLVVLLLLATPMTLSLMVATGMLPWAKSTVRTLLLCQVLCWRVTKLMAQTLAANALQATWLSHTPSPEPMATASSTLVKEKAWAQCWKWALDQWMWLVLLQEASQCQGSQASWTVLILWLSAALWLSSFVREDVWEMVLVWTASVNVMQAGQDQIADLDSKY
jgi:hypothetical protein